MIVTQAGGVVVRRGERHEQFLLVSSKRDPSTWVLPKGHVEAGESLEETAVREVREEAGVDAEIVDRLGDVSFTLHGRRLVVTFFLMRYVAEAAAAEDRRVRWCGYEDALAAIRYEATREMVRAAHTRGTELFSTDSQDGGTEV